MQTEALQKDPICVKNDNRPASSPTRELEDEQGVQHDPAEVEKRMRTAPTRLKELRLQRVAMDLKQGSVEALKSESDLMEVLDCRSEESSTTTGSAPTTTPQRR